MLAIFVGPTIWFYVCRQVHTETFSCVEDSHGCSFSRIIWVGCYFIRTVSTFWWYLQSKSLEMLKAFLFKLEGGMYCGGAH